MTENILKNAALWYLSQGYSCVPVKRDKTPLVKWQEYQKKHPTEAEIELWWNTWPDASIAVITGKVSNLTVVDWDNKGQEMPSGWDYDTPTVQSGGGGKHWWFTYQDGVNNKARFLPYFDIRSEGGYIIAPPSLHASGKTYEWIKPLGPTEVQRLPASILKDIEKSDGKDESFKKDWNKLLNEGSSSGSRNNDATAVCGKLLLRYTEPEWETEAWPLLQSWNSEKAKPPLPANELKVIFDSIAGKERKRREKKQDVGSATVSKIGETYHAIVSIEEGMIHFEFEDFAIAPRTKEADMRCRIEKMGESIRKYATRINIVSESARTNLIRSLQKGLDEKQPWTTIVSDVCEQMNAVLSSENQSIRFSDIKEVETQFLINPFLEDKSVNILFGQGGIGKTYVALKMACALAVGGKFMYSDREYGCNILFVDYESSPAIFRKRILELTMDEYGNRPDNGDYDNCFHYFNPKGIPIEDQVKNIKEHIYRLGIGLVIVDSAVLACAGEPEKADVVTRMMNALNKLEVCVLLIAHETKANQEEREIKAPFGSIYFFNSARNIWRMKGNKEPDDNVSRFLLTHTKSNNARLSSPKAGKLYFGDGFVELSPESNPVSNALWEDSMPAKKRILNALKYSPKTTDEILEETGLKRDQIRVRLNELLSRGEIQKIDDKWTIAPVHPVHGLNEARDVFDQ